MSPEVLAFIVLALTIAILAREILSIGVVGLMLPFVLIALGLSNTETALGYFVSESVILIPCVYIMSEALLITGVIDKLGEPIKRIVDKNKKSGESLLLLLIILMAGIACFFLPRYGVTGVLMPVALAMARATKTSRTKLLLVLAMAANIWGNNTLIATPPNMLANSVLQDSGAATFGFFEFALIGVPIAIGGTLVLTFFGPRLIPARVKESDDSGESRKEQSIKVPRAKMILAIVIFILFILGIVFSDTIGIKAHITGMFCVTLVIIFGVLKEKQAYHSVEWGTAFFCAGIQVLGKAIESSGAGGMIAGFVLRFLGNSPEPILVVAILFIVAGLMTQFMSNTGAAGLLFPIALSIAVTLGANPKALVMAVCMGCGSSFMTPMATPSNAMVMENGGILFNDYLKIGAPLMVATSIICIVGIPMIWPFY